MSGIGNRGDHLGLAEARERAQRVEIRRTASARDVRGRGSWGSSSYIAISSSTTWRSEVDVGGRSAPASISAQQVEDLVGVLVEGKRRVAGCVVLLAGWRPLIEAPSPSKRSEISIAELARGPLEQQMLEEMRDARPGAGGLVARPGPDPEARGRPDRTEGNLLGHDPDTRAQLW